MSTKASNYCYSGADDFVIENGIIKGNEKDLNIDNYNSYGEMILERLQADPTFVGQVDGVTGKEETFAEMREKSVKCAIWLKKQNVKPGDVVGIVTNNQMDMYIPCFASLYIGAVYNVWWDVGLTKEIAKHFVTLTRPKVIFSTSATASIAHEAIKEASTEICKIIVFGAQSLMDPCYQSLDEILQSQKTTDIANFRCTKLSSLDDPAVIIYTSGSTGLPKGVLSSNKSLFYNVYSFAHIGFIPEKPVTLLFSPLSWLSGIYCMLKGVSEREKRIICPEFTEEKCFEIIEKYKVNWILLGTSTAFRLQKSSAISNYDVSSLSIIFVGGSALKDKTQKALANCFPRTIICQGYGSTELGCAGVRQKPDYKADSCGQIHENVQMKIINVETGNTLDPNEIGEACFKSRDMMTRYYKNPEATKEVIDSEGWLHTGDLMFYDKEGNLFFVDRMKEMIKYRGNHVSPTMIEQLLQTHPAIREVAVVSIPHDIDDEHPIAFVVKKPEIKITEEEIKKIVADVLPDSMKLRGGVKFMNELPHTSSDKIARMTLKKLAKSYAC